MVFQSMLTGLPNGEIKLNHNEPNFFADLNLDLIIEGISKKHEKYGVKALLMTPLSKTEDIKYRQEVFTDLEVHDTLDAIRVFSDEMKSVLARISSLSDLFDIQREGELLDSAKVYSVSLRKLLDALRKAEVKSVALRGFKDYLETYFSSGTFQDLETDIEEAEGRVSSIAYYLIIKSGRVTVRRPDSDTLDYSNEVLSVFSKFKETQHEPIKPKSGRSYGIGHVQAEVLKLLEKVYPEEFKKLREFSSVHREFVDKTILRVFNEMQFYLAYIEYLEAPKRVGLSFCTPEFTEDKNIEVNSSFDLALAVKLSKANKSVIPNDFHLESKERILVITGPNNDGKTTFSRSIGQVFYLASLGLPVPGTKATITLQDNIFTHFERSEKIENLRGKLEDDLLRIHNIIENCTDRSVVIINEMLSSTTVGDATSIGKKILQLIVKRDCLCVFVTFIDEFSHFGTAVSMVAQVEAENPEIRTHRIIREPSNGLVYAIALAHKHKISYQDIRERIGYG